MLVKVYAHMVTKYRRMSPHSVSSVDFTILCSSAQTQNEIIPEARSTVSNGTWRSSTDKQYRRGEDEKTEASHGHSSDE